MARVFSKKIKVVLSIVLIGQLFGMTATPVQAGFRMPKVPSASSVMSEVESKYHINTEAMQEYGENANVGNNRVKTPEVSLFFSPSDPRIGEKITAKAFPVYFSNIEQDLYYTWYIKHKGCDLNETPDKPTIDLCDRNGDGHIRIGDWKIEAAKILVQNGYEASLPSASDSDNDGYEARFGGANGTHKSGTNSYCYMVDDESGELYELSSTSGVGSNASFACPVVAGFPTVPGCYIGDTYVIESKMTFPGSPAVPGYAAGDDVPGVPERPDVINEAFTSGSTCTFVSMPTCSNGKPLCETGEPRCIDPRTPTSCGVELYSCSTSVTGGATSKCEHLFYNPATTGDGNFGQAEEDWWGTNPADPSTADNGMKDEANLVGLGRSSFTWNYVAGDQVGVAVEGTSMIPTKHDDSSSMIMWAFPKKCSADRGKKSSYYKTIKGYDVEIPSVDYDLNDCIKDNLVDPTEGGQATNIELSVSATPEMPINDASFVISGGVKVAEGNGDTVRAEASVSNASRNASEMFFEWKVEMANNPQFTGGSGDVTSQFQALKLLGNTKGIALDAVNLKLDILDDPSMLFAGRQLGSYLDRNGIGYLRFRVEASENFASGVVRKGKSDVVVRFTSTDKKITVYKPETEIKPGWPRMKVKLPNIGTIMPLCDDDSLDRVSCRIIKNEVIGLYIDPTGLTNYQWSINGAPLRCNREFVSENCAIGEQNNVNFFPVTGNVGDTYTVTVSANDVSTGKTVNLARSFHVIKPELLLQSADLGTAWPKLVGQYKDVDGASSVACPGGFCNQYSDSVLEGFSTETLKIQSDFIPDFLGAQAKRQWTIDGTLFPDVASAGPPAVYTISFVALKEAPDVYNIALSASVQQSQEMRRALRDIWNVSPLESTEILFNTMAQIQLKEPGYAQGTLQGTKKYLAALSSYVPTSVMFSLRVLLSVLLILFTTRFLLALLPEQPNFSTVPRRRG